MRNMSAFITVMLVTAFVAGVWADTVTWTGDGGSDTRWTNPANWAGGVLPAFDGTEDVVISKVNNAGTVMDLDGDKWINSLNTSVASPNFIISNSVLRVNDFIRKGNQAQVYIKSGVEIVDTLTIKSDNNSNQGIYLAGEITEVEPGGNLIVENSLGTVFLMNTNSSYSGDTIVRRGTLQLSAATPAVGRGVAGVANNPIIVGDSQTGANNWNVTIIMPDGVDVGRTVHVVDTGSSVKPEVSLAGGAGSRTFELILDTDISLRHTSPGNKGLLAGFVRGVGGFERTGGTEILQVGNVTNAFSGDVSITYGRVNMYLDGTNNAFGKGETPVVINSFGGNVTRGLLTSGSGTFSRAIELASGTKSTSQAITITIGPTDSGTVVFSGDMVMETPDPVSFSAANNGSVEFSGVISGDSPVIQSAGHTGSGNRICLSNPNNTFIGQLKVGAGLFFVGANAPRGGPGALGANTIIDLNYRTGGVNSPGLLAEGSYLIGQDIVISNTGFNGQIYLGGAAADCHPVYSGDVINLRTNFSPAVRLQSGKNSLVTFSGKITGPGDWRIQSGWPAKFTTGSGDIEFTNPDNDFTGVMNTTDGHLWLAATGSDGDPGGVFEFGSTTTGAKIGVLTSGPATVRRSGSVYPHSNANGECTLGGITSHESRFAGDYDFTRLSAYHKNYLYATNGATVHFDGLVKAGASHSITKRGPGRVNINGPLLVPTFTVTEGTLGGSGSMTNKLAFPSGTTFSPGSPLGTLVVSNTVTLNSGSTFLAQIHKTYAGMAEVWGDVTINSGVTFVAPDKPCSDRVILRYHAALNGAFSVTNMPSSAKLSYGAGFNSEIRLTIPSPGTLLIVR